MKLHESSAQPRFEKESKTRWSRYLCRAGQDRRSRYQRRGFALREGGMYRQGGNLPFYRRLPFMRGQGFTPLNRIDYNEVNLDQLSSRHSKPMPK
jgi:large subunit ribosomal protein L15